MKLFSKSATTALLIALCFGLFSCEKDADKRASNEFSKTGIILGGAQETPAVTTTAAGKMDVFYSRATKTLSYTVTWSGLSGNVTGMHIHGLAPAGFAAPVLQSFSTSAIIKCTANTTTNCGTFKGTLLFDGVALKEEDLLNGLFYVNIHTAANPGGEIRGQINLSK